VLLCIALVCVVCVLSPSLMLKNVTSICVCLQETPICGDSFREGFYNDIRYTVILKFDLWNT
jgi:hypothetical protein